MQRRKIEKKGREKVTFRENKGRNNEKWTEEIKREEVGRAPSTGLQTELEVKTN